MMTRDQTTQAIAPVQRDPKDVGSPQAQVAILTQRIKDLTEHMKLNKHDFHARRGLLQMVGQRKRQLAYLQKKDFAGYQTLIAKLGLRK